MNQKSAEERGVTQFHRILKRLDIELICANSPQAKGRVERANRTLQDRLIKELREKEINGMEEGNAFLEEFRLEYNKRFAVSAREGDAHRALLPSHKKKHLLLPCEERKLSKDLSFEYRSKRYEVESDFKRRLVGKKVEIYEYRGEIKLVMQGDRELKYHLGAVYRSKPPRILDRKEVVSLWPEHRHKPKRNHPWR